MANIEFISILAIAVGLSADCLAVAIVCSVSCKEHYRSDLLRVSLSFGLFQALMPALGWLTGRTLVAYIGKYDHWVAFVLLAFVGAKMLWESFQSKTESVKKTDNTKGLPLLILSIATSIDALAVGLSFAFLKVNIFLACLTIGIVAFVVTATGFMIGRKSNKFIGKQAELIGAIILIAIGVRILLSGLF